MKKSNEPRATVVHGRLACSNFPTPPRAVLERALKNPSVFMLDIAAIAPRAHLVVERSGHLVVERIALKPEELRHLAAILNSAIEAGAI